MSDLPYIASDGKTYQRPHCQAEDLYRIAAYMKADRRRPALKAIKDYLAKAGAFMDEERLEHQKAREIGKAHRSEFTDAIRDQVIDADRTFYGQATDEIYLGTLGRTSTELKEELETNRVRDAMHAVGVSAVGLAEAMSAVHLRQQQRVKESARRVIRQDADAVGKTLREAGIDGVTGEVLPLNAGAYDTLPGPTDQAA
jgi:hypothetical protein